MLLRIFCALLAITSVATPALADWHEASSDHFVIYADQSEKTVREYAEKLERYDAAMRQLMPRDATPPSPSNRVTVYVVGTTGKVRKLLDGGKGSRYVAGFYNARAGGSLAIIPQLESGTSDLNISGLTILLHEYAHHFVYGASANSYPLWLSEGFAEFFASAKFEKDGSVGLGLPAMHRGYELSYAKSVPIALLLDSEKYLSTKSQSYDEFYGRSWLLYHHLFFNAERKGQLRDYVKAILAGTSESEAAKIFGDLKALEKDLDRYQAQRKWSYINQPAASLKIGEIGTRALTPGEAALMPALIRSKRGVDEEQAKEVVIEARAVAAKFPNDVAVLSELAEAEYDAGNDDAAIAASDAAIAIDPNRINPQLQKAYAMSRQAEAITDDKTARKAWGAVRAQLLKANAIENNHPLPLSNYYMTYLKSGVMPTKNAVAGLEWALQLAPYDEQLRFAVAQQDMVDGDYDGAISVLRPLANSPHKAEMAAAAQEMIRHAEEAKTGEIASGDAAAEPTDNKNSE
jgi:Protein of unknown function (DUF1570)